MTTKHTICTGTDDFAKLLLESTVFVDKSLFIKEFLEDSGEVVLITRPPRWGKTLNMDMLGRFLALEVDDQGAPLPPSAGLNHKLFAGGEIDLGLATGQTKQLSALKIAQHQELMAAYQGWFPVISLSFKNVKGNSYQEIQTKIGQELLALFKRYDYLLNSSQVNDYERSTIERYLHKTDSVVDITNSLHLLSELLSQHFGKPVYVLVDEYDTPINSAYLEFKDRPAEFKQVLELLLGLLCATFKTNKYLKKGLITGMLRIAKTDLFSGLNNVREYTLLDEWYANCYGFTQEEVDELLDKVPTPTPAKELQYWYNGYTFGDKIIYNPCSIMNCLARQGKLDHYWVESGGTAVVDEFLLSARRQADLQTLLGGGRLVYPIDKQIRFDELGKSTDLYSWLLFNGYLTPKAVDATRKIYQLSIPNYEVQYLYRRRVLEWVANQLSIEPSDYEQFSRLLASGNLGALKEKLQELLQGATSFHQTGPQKAELFYSGFMLGLLSTLSTTYVLESERESGLGRPDAVLIPKQGQGDQALIIAYKVSKELEGLAAAAQAGLGQLEAQGYATKLKEHAQVKRMLEVCMAFCGKEVALAYRQVTL